MRTNCVEMTPVPTKYSIPTYIHRDIYTYVSGYEKRGTSCCVHKCE